MKIILTAIDEALAAAWLSIDLPDVQVYRGSILDLEVDAIVSPTNSFGFMDGGIDWVYTQHFGIELQEKVQHAIREEFHSELLVGQVYPSKWPAVIAAPTMRVPMDVSQSINAYLAARAALRVADDHELKLIAFPGLCTGVGGMAPELCAKQVGCAIREFQRDDWRDCTPQSWREAQQKHEWLRTL